MAIFTTNIWANIAIIGAAFFVLNWASNITINNAIKVAEITRLGKTSVGFTLIAMSTTLPELTVALTAAISGGAALSVGNVLGSNIFNITAIIGLAAVLLYFTNWHRSRKTGVRPGKSELNILQSLAKADLSSIQFGLFISSVIPMILIYISNATWGVGLILLFIFAGYLYKLLRVRMPEEENVPVSLEEKSKLKRYALLTILGGLGVVVSANFLVDSAVTIAESFNVSQTAIGATIVAFGTSLPELTIGLKSVLKGHSSLAFGNIIGASFINTTLILGISFFVPSLVGTTVNLTMEVFRNLVTFSIITNLFFWYFLSREKITWREGVIFLFIYILFLVTTIAAV
jgi:cation:H+ antiporter